MWILCLSVMLIHDKRHYSQKWYKSAWVGLTARLEEWRPVYFRVVGIFRVIIEYSYFKKDGVVK